MSAPSEVLSRECFDYMVKNDVPNLVDGVCKVLFHVQPEDPLSAIAQHFQARKHGNHHGGALFGGLNSSGGWIRCFGSSGAPMASVDKIPMVQDTLGELQLMCGSSKEMVVFVASTAGMDNASDSNNNKTSNTFLRKYDVKTGELLDAHEFGGKAITAVLCHREPNHIWVFFKSGGFVVLQASNGAVLREAATTPPVQAAAIRDNSLFLLSVKSIERRDMETMQLEQVMHLPDSMMKPTTFSLNSRHVWCASANPDGSANYIGIYDVNGRPVSTFMPPPSSMITVDVQRRGTWHLPRQNGAGGSGGSGGATQLVFVNERGSKVMMCDIGKYKKGNLAVDRGSGLLWMYRVENEKPLCSLYHPYLQQFVTEVAAPDVTSMTTFVVPL